MIQLYIMWEKYWRIQTKKKVGGASGSLEYICLPSPLEIWRMEGLALFQLLGIWVFWRKEDGDWIREKGNRSQAGTNDPQRCNLLPFFNLPTLMGLLLTPFYR